MKNKPINESIQSAQQLIDLVKDSIHTADKKTKEGIVLPTGYLEKVCGAIAGAHITETCEWVRSTFVQFTKAAHEGEANHFEPRTVMHFMNDKHEPAFDIVLNFWYNYDTRVFMSKRIMFGIPPSEKLKGHKELTDLLTDYQIKCVEVANYNNEDVFRREFADDYNHNIKLMRPLTVDELKEKLPLAIKDDADYAVRFFGEDWQEDGEVPEFDYNDILNDTNGTIKAQIDDAEKAGIEFFPYVTTKEELVAEFNKVLKAIYSDLYEAKKVNYPAPQLNEDEVNREQYYDMIQVLLAQFNKVDWNSIEFAFGKDNELSIIPKFVGDEKNENTVKEFIVKVNGKVVKNLCAQTVERLARQLADFRNNLNDPPIHVNVKLSGVTYNGVNGKENVQDNIRDCNRGDEVKLVRIKNIHAYDDVDMKDETAIEVRTMDNKALGYLPANLIEKDRIARKLVQHKPYTAKVYTKLGGHGMYKNLGIVISIDFN